MTAYTLAANATLRDVGTAGIWGVATARTGGDTVDTNGFKLTIDQDSRYGFSGTTSTTWGSLTINAAKGGEIHIDGTKVWMIPFTGGSGTLTTSQISLTNGAAFTSAGGLYMPTIGMTATFETPEYILGHTSFQNSALVMAGGTVGNYTFGYQIDKNDGSGWSTLTSGSTAAQLGTALSGITGIDASKGFKLRIKITTGTTNTTAITSVYVLTNSTTTAQDYQYPLDVNTVTFTGLPTGCDPVVSTIGDYRVLVKNTVPVQAQGIVTSGSAGPSANDIVTAILAAAQVTPIHANVQKMNDADLIGNGTAGDKWRGA